MKYKAVLVDADDTILDFKATELEALKPVLIKYNIPVTEDVISNYSRINLSYWKKLEKKELTHQEVITKRWDEFFSLYNVAGDAREVNDLYFKIMQQGAYLVPGAEAFLAKLSKDYQVYIITNGNPTVQYPRLEKSGILKYISGVFISMEIGVNKPDIEFFKYVLNKIKLTDEDCIVLGDSLSSDMQGAINAGIDHVLFDRFDKHLDFDGKRINKLEDFFNCLK